MPFMQDIECNYILDHLSFVREYDESNFKKFAHSALNKTSKDLVFNKIDHYSHVISVGIDTISDIKMNDSDVHDFLSNTSNIYRLNSDSPTIAPIYPMDSIIIKPQYLSQYVNNVNNIISDLFDNKLSESIINKVLDGDFQKKVKKQIVTTTMDIDENTTDADMKKLLKSLSVQESRKLNEVYVKKELLPFVFKFKKLKNSIIGEANSVLHSVEESEQNFKYIYKAIADVMKDANFEDKDDVDRFIYNLMRDYLDVLGYCSLMITHKMTLFSKNVATAQQCYNIIKNRCKNINESFDEPSMSILFPTDSNSLRDDLESGRMGAYDNIANQLFEFHSNNPMFGTISGDLKSVGDIMHSSFDTHVDLKSYNKKIYDDILIMYDNISNGLDVLEDGFEDYLIVLHDLRNEAGFTVPLDVRYENTIKRISQLDYYKSDIPGITDNNKFYTILSEVHHFPKVLDSISKACMDTKNKMEELADKFNRETNDGVVKDVESVNELKLLITELMSEYHKLNELISTALMNRLKALGGILTSLTVSDSTKTIKSEIVPTTTVEYSLEGFINELEEFDNETIRRMNLLEEAFYKERNMMLRGVLVTEEDGTNNQQNTTVGQTQSSTTTQTTNTNNNTQTTTDLNTVKVSQKLNGDLTTFVSKESALKDSQQQFLVANKQALQNREYQNNTRNIDQFNNLHFNSSLEKLNKVIGFLNQVQGVTLQNYETKEKAQNSVLNVLGGGLKINEGESSNTSIRTRIQNVMSYGDSTINKGTYIAISNSDLGNFVKNEVIPYVEGYHGVNSRNIQNVINALAKASDEMVDRIGATNSNTNDTQNKNTAGHYAQALKWINDILKDIVQGSLHSFQERNNAYMNLLKSLVPQTTGEAQPSVNPQNQQQAAATATTTGTPINTQQSINNPQ